MNRRNPTLYSGDEKAFPPISRPTQTSPNAYNQLPPIPGQANLSHHLLPTMNGSPPVSVSSDYLQFNEPSCNNMDVKPRYHPSHPNFYVRPDKSPPKFNSYAWPSGPPPFSNVNPGLDAPLPSDFNTKYNRPPPFLNFDARPNVSPSCATFHNTFNRPPPFVDTNGMADRPLFQTNSYSRPEKSHISEPLPNLFNMTPFPGNFNVSLVKPPPFQVGIDGGFCLPPPNANCQSSEFRTNVSSDPNYFANNIRNTTCSNFIPRQQLSPRSDGLIPLPFQLPTPFFQSSTSNNSFPAVTSCQPSLPISSPLHSRQTLSIEQTYQPFQSSDGSARPSHSSSTLQHQHSFSHVGHHGSRDFTKDLSCLAVSPTHLEAVLSCSAPPPSRYEKAGTTFSATTRSIVASAPVIPLHPLHHQVISFKKDQDWVNKWLEERGKQKTKNESAAVSKNSFKDYTDNRRDGQIIIIKADDRNENILKRLEDVHARVVKYTKLLEELRQCHYIGEDEKVSSVKVELDDISSQLLDPCYQSAVRRLVAARRKKRTRAKRSRQMQLERWQARSRNMDRQRELLYSQNKTEEMQKRLVAEADAVLHEVRGKKEETVSLQLLLASLRDLRQHRLNKGDQQGFVATQHHTERFEKVSAGLDEMLESQLQDYELEERTLRVMLDQQRGSGQLSKVLNATHDDTSDQETQIASLREGLFDCSAPADPALLASYTAADTSREMLLSRRRAWDKHLVKVGGSGIPIFWVTPPEKNSGGWEKWRVQS